MVPSRIAKIREEGALLPWNLSGTSRNNSAICNLLRRFRVEIVGLDGVGAAERSRKTHCVQFGSDSPEGSGVLRVFRENSLAPTVDLSPRRARNAAIAL